MSNDQQTAQAGWYAEPGTGQQRYWDGQAWGVYAAPAPGQPVSAPPPQAQFYAAPQAAGGEYQAGLVVTGYILAVLLPIVGLILGIVTITRPSKATSKHGIWIILLAIVAFAIFYAALASKGTSGA